VLISFDLRGEKTREDAARLKRHAVKIQDSVLPSLSKMYISPSSQAENMIIYQFSGSRVVCDVIGKLYGGGSYSSIQRTIDELAEVEPKFPSGDIIVAYDNNQKIGRQYRVTWQGKIPFSVITGITAFTPVHPSFIQQQTFIPTCLHPPE
jgi:hypothetical protein